MSQTGVTVVIQDSVLSTPANNDGMAMLILPMTTTSTYETEGVKIVSIAEFEALTDYANFDPASVYNVTQFFQKAGAGSPLWIMSYLSATEGEMTNLNFENVKIGIRNSVADIWDNRARLVGLVYSSSIIADVGQTGLLSELTTPVTGIIAKFKSFFNDMFIEGFRMGGVLDAGILGDDLTSLVDTATFDAYPVQLCITGSDPTMPTGVGEAIGVLASIPIAQSMGNQNTVLANVAYFITGKTLATCKNVATQSISLINDLGSKQYLFARTRQGKAGVFYNDGATMNVSTKALSKMEFVRVANSICDSAYTFFGDLINTQAIASTFGALDATYKAGLESQFDELYIQTRISEGQISDATVTVQAKDGNIINSRTLEIDISVLPAPNLERANITLVFVTELTA